MLKQVINAYRENRNQLKSLRSYSQCGEDLIIIFLFKNLLLIDNPNYIDIGAHHPFYLSNTALFYKLGSSGINIEPNPELFKKFQKYRKRDINLNIGIHRKEGEMCFYSLIPNTLSTFSADEAEKLVQQGYELKSKDIIKTDNISNIIEKHCKGIFPDFLSLDAEGIDGIVLEGIDFNGNYPKVICVETLGFSNKVSINDKNTKLMEFILDNDYYHYGETFINSIFVKKGLF